MFRANVAGGSSLATVLMVVAVILIAAGCGGGGGDRDRVPTFEDSSISDKMYVQNLAIVSETLPEASGGDGALTYTMSPELPDGLTFDPATRLLSGMPAAPQPAILYTYSVMDSDTAGPDSASLDFTITVQEDLVPTFEQVSIANRSYVQNLEIVSETLPEASGGDGALTYTNPSCAL